MENIEQRRTTNTTTNKEANKQSNNQTNNQTTKQPSDHQPTTWGAKYEAKKYAEPNVDPPHVRLARGPGSVKPRCFFFAGGGGFRGYSYLSSTCIFGDL